MEVIRLKVERGTEGLFYGTSPDEPGLLIAGNTEPEVRAQAADAIVQLRIVGGRAGSADFDLEVLR